jgi:hypothetical protein
VITSDAWLLCCGSERCARVQAGHAMQCNRNYYARKTVEKANSREQQQLQRVCVRCDGRIKEKGRGVRGQGQWLGCLRDRWPARELSSPKSQQVLHMRHLFWGQAPPGRRAFVEGAGPGRDCAAPSATRCDSGSIHDITRRISPANAARNDRQPSSVWSPRRSSSLRLRALLLLPVCSARYADDTRQLLGQ